MKRTLIPIVLHGLRKEMKSLLMKKYLVRFTIGKFYKDEIWLAVIPMDVCHIIGETMEV